MTGTIYSDNVIITASDRNYSATGLQFGALDTKTIGLELPGVIGLGFNQNEDNNNIVYNLMPKGQRSFSIYLYLN